MKKHHTVTVYTGESKFSSMVKDYFRQENIDFEEVYVKPDSPEFEYIKKKTEQITLPVVEIDGRPIVGYRPDLYDIIFKKGDDQEEIIGATGGSLE